ncbi:MAG TPA: glycosyltransferase family 4 protein [Gaiellaceae bacterium]
MKVLVVSGIWPPDVGGPASHAPEVAAFLQERGHDVRAFVSADRAPTPESYPLDWVARRSPFRHGQAVGKIARLARGADVVYSTGMVGRAGSGSTLAGTPFVLKIAGDPAFERALRRGLTSGTLAEFQHERSPATLPLRLVRNAIVRRSAHVITPSTFLRDAVFAWGVPNSRVSVLPNPAPAISTAVPREDLRARFGMQGPTLVFAGRLVAAKSLELGIEAARRAGIDLVVAGDGPERSRLEGLGHARFLGALPREQVLELFRAGDVSLLTSSWENFPHGVVESLAAGTPVVATAVGGVTEIIGDGENGLLVPSGDIEATTAAIQRIFFEPGLLERLRGAAAVSVSDYSRERVYERLLDILHAAAER